MGKSTYIKVAAITGALAVILGAFGAHLLTDRLSEHQIQTWHTGVQYHFYHSILLVILGISVQAGFERKSISRPFWLLFAGICCFSGSLYFLSIKDLFTFLPPSLLGPITPIGGMLLIVGWLFLPSIKETNN